MGSILERLRNIQAHEVSPTEPATVEVQQQMEKTFDPLVWRAISRSIHLLRTFLYEDKYYFVFFIYTPTVFKTRGRYVVIEREDKEKFKLMLNMTGYQLHNFAINSRGDISTAEQVPFLNLNTQGNFSTLYDTDNSRDLQVRDLLDLLDFLMLLDGEIHMNPFKEVPKLTDMKEVNSKFELGPIQDYRRKIYEFITSQEKSTLSYRYLIKGYELQDGVEVEKLKFFQYPLLNNKGEIGVNEIEVTIPRTEENRYYINKYIGHLIKPGSMGIYKGTEIYFIIDTAKLEPIRTLHEIPISRQLVASRERCRLLLKSLGAFKSSLKTMALRVGVPIYEDNMYTYGALEKIEDGYSIIHKTRYTSRDTKLGNVKFKEILDKSGVKTMNYIENLINQYVEGKLDVDFLTKHIQKSDEVFPRAQSLNEALKILFTSIRGKSLKEMFELAQKTYIALERENNSLKLRLHVFKESPGEVDDFCYRALSSLPKNMDFNNSDYFLLEYEVMEGSEKDNFTVEVKTEIKY